MYKRSGELGGELEELGRKHRDTDIGTDKQTDTHTHMPQTHTHT